MKAQYEYWLHAHVDYHAYDGLCLYIPRFVQKTMTKKVCRQKELFLSRIVKQWVCAYTYRPFPEMHLLQDFWVKVLPQNIFYMEIFISKFSNRETQQLSVWTHYESIGTTGGTFHFQYLCVSRPNTAAFRSSMCTVTSAYVGLDACCFILSL